MKELRIVCSTLPSHKNPELIEIEIENEAGESVNVGVWRERPDKLWELVISLKGDAS